jgi:hypothetical protein
VVVDLAAHDVGATGCRAPDPIEFRLLAALIAGHGKVLTHRQLLLQVWGAEYLDRPHYLRVHMANLRQKMEQDPAQPAHLVTELQVGYRLVGLAADSFIIPLIRGALQRSPASHELVSRGVRLGFHPATTLAHAFCAVSRFFPFCCRTWFFIQDLEKTMNAAVRFNPADSAITDISLAAWGRKEIKIAETEMPGLMAVRENSLLPSR